MERTFTNGQFVYREGEQGHCAFEVVSGIVELIRPNNGGPKPMRAGDLFGELSVLDRAPRDSDAQARGNTVVRVIPAETLFDRLEHDQRLAMKVIGRLVERARESDSLPPEEARQQSRNATPPPQTGATAFPIARPAATPSRVRVLVARLDGDEGGRVRKLITGALEDRDGITVKPLREVLGLSGPGGKSRQFAEAGKRGRQWLEQEEGQVLVWGEVLKHGRLVRLHFLTPSAEDEYRPGGFSLGDWLDLPTDLGPALSDLFYGITLAASLPRSEGLCQILYHVLPRTLKAAYEQGYIPDKGLDPEVEGSLAAAYGNAAAVAGYYDSRGDWYAAAITAYRRALKLLPHKSMPVEWAITQRHLAIALAARGERLGQSDDFRDAVDAFDSALEVFTRDSMPKSWAGLMNRKGVALYRIGQIDSVVGPLKEGFGAYQAALQVLTREDAPERWAEVMNNLGQLLQLMGALMRRPSMIKGAVDSCLAALEVRQRNRFPLLWASSQNNLGSALFLLGRATNDTRHLQQAVAAFSGALEVYREEGALAMIRITENNLHRVEAHARQLADGMIAAKA